MAGAFTTSIKIEGLSVLEKKLHTLPKRVGKNILRQGIREAAKVIQEEATRRLGKGKGYILRQDGVKPHGNYYRATAQVGITAKKKKGKRERDWAVHFIEFGTSPHVIIAGKRMSRGRFYGKTQFKSLRFFKDGQEVHARWVIHPGQPRRPFLRPAYHEKREEAVRAMARFMDRRIKEEARK